jgi:bifunctional UDP-N-acetylglucosamine pyrophosphorylase/glucosamine-1-phosphate N-acetyltransferase
MSRPSLGVIVLAAGPGTRLKSALPKPLHPVCGVPMVQHVIDAARTLEPGRIVVTVGHGGNQVREALAGEDVVFVEQTEMLGTGDAVRRCREALEGCGEIMVLNGDCPLVTGGLLASLAGSRGSSPLALVAARVEDQGRLGRLLRDSQGHPERIVEAADWQGEGGPAEINGGQYVFDAAWLWGHINDVPLSAKGEYYLTGLVWMASTEASPGMAVEGPAAEVLGVDDRVKLAEAERIMRARIIERHQLAGVTVSDPATTYIDAAVRLAEDVTVLPGSYLQGRQWWRRNQRLAPERPFAVR